MLSESELCGGPGPDQSSWSLDSGEVLIRSTRVLPGPTPVQITVQKLRDPPVKPLQTRATGGAPVRGRLSGQPGRVTQTNLGPSKENRCPPSGHDLLTSRFVPGGRGIVLAALKQRSHSAPHRREVKVQLLDPGPPQTSSHDAPGPRSGSQDNTGPRSISQDPVGVSRVQMEAGPSSGCPGDVSSAAAAAAAAAMSAAVPLIKVQSDLEARVSQLADGVEKLLQADRDGVDSGRSLNQQMLHHLEKLHSQQIELQSQLLQSTLSMAKRHAPTTSDLPAPGQPACLRVTHLEATENKASHRHRSAAINAMETGPVTMATAHQQEQTRGRQRHRGESSIITATRAASGCHPQFLANHSKAAASRANEMLKEMGRLRAEMKTLLTAEDSLKTSTAEPDQHNPPQSPQTSSQRPLSPSRPPTEPHITTTLQSEEQQNHQTPTPQVLSKPKLARPGHTHSLQSTNQKKQPHSLSTQGTSQQTQTQQAQTHQTQQTQTHQPILVQKRRAVSSTLEQAGHVLHQVRRQRKVLEENLESMLRARSGEVLHCQLDALSANRDWTEEVRIKRTVDAWISVLSKDIQAEVSAQSATSCPAADTTTRNLSERDPALTSQRAAGRSAHRGNRRPVRGRGRGQPAAEVKGVEPVRASSQLAERKQVEDDGEAYLSHLYGRAPYDGVRRTLKKSPYLRFSSPLSPPNRKPRPRLVERVRGVKVKSCKTQTCLAPPFTRSLGRPQHHYTISSAHLTSADPADLTVTPAGSYPVTTAIPLGPPRMDSSSRCPSSHQQEVTSAPPPAATVVTMGDREEELQPQQAETNEGEAPPPPSVDIMEEKGEEEEEEEDNVFPGTDFLSVTDVIQQQEVSVGGEEEVELAGGPSPPPVLYQGPVFPPQAPPAPPSQDQTSMPGMCLQRDPLESRLLEWVEQQLMSRMISEMYRPPPSDPAQLNSTDQSETEEQSVTSDAVESSLIHQLVNEVLMEVLVLMLRDMQEPEPEPELGPAVAEEIKLVPLVPTPVPTPPPSPTTPIRETPPLTTPPPSEPTSLLQEETPQPIAALETVTTPTPSPEPAPSAESPEPPPIMDNTDLPLDEEENPEERQETRAETPPMTAAQPEPPSALPPPSPPPRPDSPSSSSDDSSSSSSSNPSSSSVEPEAALKHISEGELLINTLAAAAADADGVCSFSSSLQELQDMDFDPPSEGQVRGRDLLLTLLTKMEQGVRQRGERPQPEGSWGREREEEEEMSVGEVREDLTTKPHKTTNQMTSTGQISADVSEVSIEAANQCLVAMGDLLVEPMGTLTSDLQTDLLLTPPPHLVDTLTAGQVSPVPVPPSDSLSAGSHSGGARRRDVQHPPITPQEREEEKEVVEEVMEELVSAAETDSSVSDVF